MSSFIPIASMYIYIYIFTQHLPPENYPTVGKHPHMGMVWERETVKPISPGPTRHRINLKRNRRLRWDVPWTSSVGSDTETHGSLGNKSMQETRAILGGTCKSLTQRVTWLSFGFRSLFRGYVKLWGCICMFTLCIHVSLSVSSTLASLAQNVCPPNKHVLFISRVLGG